MTDEESARPATVAARKRARAPARGRARKAKPVRWSAKRETIFLETLAETSNVAASARVSGLSESNIYRKRRKDEDFRARWAAALREGVARLETMLLGRALNGVEKPVWHGGKKVGTMIEYSDRLALALLNAHRGASLGGAEASERSVEDVRADFLRRLATAIGCSSAPGRSRSTARAAIIQSLTRPPMASRQVRR
ncbi:hypothetical protein [Sphingomonas nostoxanthinifaciens]|uniref:hypothetical protein n=1 Tax=Sphingomonas nostoxanthinifaciens TaxID=2872652 RepID=UPI001CC1FF1C|nr:hypothetical protein [Sphingomonas nostoxanthinifaciens]UAK23999.1 hypothetical protein K8P63_16835 [Sphingomonas nostoxanthinifaciens]